MTVTDHIDRFVIIVAGGSGKRMGSEIPKQFLLLAGKPVLMHTVEKFHDFDGSMKIIIVLPPEHTGYWDELKEKYSFNIPHIVAMGGTNRFFSVRNGLELVSGGSVAAIHDGVRPFVTTETINRCFATALKLGNAIPVISPADSLRMVTGMGSVPVNREHIKQVQTPQVFLSDLIKNAYRQEYSESFTDDATVLERTGEIINLVEGNRENIKITTPGDLLICETLLKATS